MCHIMHRFIQRMVCHRGPPSTARAQVDHRTEIVAKLLNYAPAKPAHQDSALIVSIGGFQGCGVAGSGRKSYLDAQQNAYLKGSITPEYSFSDFFSVLTQLRLVSRVQGSLDRDGARPGALKGD